MILILSTDIDSSTYDVMKFITFKGKEVYRINDNDLFRIPLKIYHEDNKICFKAKINNKWIYSADISVVWYRKFGFIVNYEGYSQFLKIFGKTLATRVTTEYRKTLDLILKSLDHCHWLCHYEGINLNKFEVLLKAQSCGLIIPESIITTHKTFLQEHSFKSKPIITKSIGDILFISPEGEDHEIAVLTTDLSEKRVSLSDRFFPSLIQEKIEKQFELRIFYLDGKCYTMAIFSQANNQTKVDFRQYDYQNPNRWVPFDLDKSVQQKIKKLMKLLNLNTGSIDMIYNNKGEYVFLEVNPSGQFGMTSYPCNFNLEEKIADYLINTSKLVKNKN
jgi:ATP-GRASP peptide maturase of grasp-with-spasm system